MTIYRIFIFFSGTSISAKFLRANGITLFKVRDETVNLLGKSDLYVFSPEHPPLTEPAKRALKWALDQKLKSGHFYLRISIYMFFFNVCSCIGVLKSAYKISLANDDLDLCWIVSYKLFFGVLRAIMGLVTLLVMGHHSKTKIWLEI